MNLNKQKGLITELQCELAFSELGLLVCQPIIEDSRYDYLIDLGNSKFIRVQCKTSSYLEDKTGFSFSCRSTRSNTQGIYQRDYTKEEIDYFYTYCNEKSYLIPVEEASSKKTLRFVPPKNNNSNYNKAENYEIEKILANYENINTKKIQQNVLHSNINQKSSTCQKCGKTITYGATLCKECAALNSRIVKERPSREELKNLIRNNSMLQVGKKFGVTDNTIRKWCKAVNLPSKKKEIDNYSDEEWRLI